MPSYRSKPNWMPFTWQSQIISTVSGLISLASSSIGMSIILRSAQPSPSRSRTSQAFRSPYHRIMFFMFFWDTLSSISIAMTTLPMPSDVQDVYQFPGRSFGNSTTCSVQALLITAGQFFSATANLMLNVYYLCTLRYGVPKERINNRVIPIMLTVISLVGVPGLFIILRLQLFNPRPHEPYCYIGSYPEHCNNPKYSPPIQCINKEVAIETENQVFLTCSLIIGSSVFLVLVSMMLIIATVFKTERLAMATEAVIVFPLNTEAEESTEKSKAKGEGNHNDEENDYVSSAALVQPPPQPQSDSPSTSKKFARTRTVVRVAMMYILAFLVTWIWSMLGLLSAMNIIKFSSQQTWDNIGYGRLAFSPLQGFFNVAIFIYNKVQDYHEIVHRGTSCWSVIVMVIKNPSVIPEVMITRIEMVNEAFDVRENNEQLAIHEANVEGFSEFQSIQTPRRHCSQELSKTGMKNEDFEQSEDLDPHNTPPVRNYYLDPDNVDSNPAVQRQAENKRESSSQIRETPSFHSSDLLSHDETKNGSRSVSANSLLSGFYSVFYPTTARSKNEEGTRDISAQEEGR